MEVPEHCASLVRVMNLWENNVFNRLGSFPDKFQKSCRDHVRQYLIALKTHSQKELDAIDYTLREFSEE